MQAHLERWAEYGTCLCSPPDRHLLLQRAQLNILRLQPDGLLACSVPRVCIFSRP